MSPVASNEAVCPGTGQGHHWVLESPSPDRDIIRGWCQYCPATHEWPKVPPYRSAWVETIKRREVTTAKRESVSSARQESQGSPTRACKHCGERVPVPEGGAAHEIARAMGMHRWRECTKAPPRGQKGGAAPADEEQAETPAKGAKSAPRSLEAEAAYWQGKAEGMESALRLLVGRADHGDEEGS